MIHLENAFMKIMNEMKANIDEVTEEAQRAIEKATLLPPEK